MTNDSEVIKVEAVRRPIPKRVTFKTITWVATGLCRKRCRKPASKVIITNTPTNDEHFYKMFQQGQNVCVENSSYERSES